MTIKEFKFNGHTISLQLTPDVFEPNLTTRLLTEVAVITEDSRVLDLGCGAGPVAIVSALNGARETVGVDIMPQACELARRNAELNNVQDRVQIVQGNLFDALPTERFDIIIDDVSGMAEEVSRISPWYPESIPTGGLDGTSHALAMLEQAREHLTEGGRLYFPVLSLAKSETIITFAQRTFGPHVKRVADKWVPFCKEFIDQLDTMERMKKEGLIDYITKRSRHLWRLEIYKATNYSF